MTPRFSAARCRAAPAALATYGSGYLAGGTSGGGIGDQFLLARYDGDGDLDPAFGDGGVAEGPAGQLAALAVAPLGAILTAGPDADGAAQLVRYDPQGEVALTKPIDVPGATDERVGALAATADGGALVAGTALVGTDRRVFLARLTAQGVLDPAFGTGGATLVDVGDLETGVRALAVQPDGKLLVAGTTDEQGAGGGFVARFTDAGAPDAGFSTDGIARLGVPSAVASALALQPDGKVLVAGAADLAAPDTDGLVARFRPGGVRDPGFGSDGVARRSLGTEDELTGVGVTSGGRIVAGGFTPSALVLERLTGGDAADPALTMSADGLGDLITFTITVPNHGPDPVQGVQVSVRPPGARHRRGRALHARGRVPGHGLLGRHDPRRRDRPREAARARRAGGDARGVGDRHERDLRPRPGEQRRERDRLDDAPVRARPHEAGARPPDPAEAGARGAPPRLPAQVLRERGRVGLARRPLARQDVRAYPRAGLAEDDEHAPAPPHAGGEEGREARAEEEAPAAVEAARDRPGARRLGQHADQDAAQDPAAVSAPGAGAPGAADRRLLRRRHDAGVVRPPRRCRSARRPAAARSPAWRAAGRTGRAAGRSLVSWLRRPSRGR